MREITRALCLSVALFVSAVPAWANARITLLMDALQIEEVVEILRIEGLAHADTLDAEILDGQGGAFWSSQVRQIYTPDLISEQLRQALTTGLTPDDIEAILAFFATEDTRQIVTLENAARRAMMDPVVEEGARAAVEAQSTQDDPHHRLVQQFIAVNDLLDRNLAGTMSAYVQFYRGLSDGRYLIQSEEQILEEVWSQQESIRAETTAWVSGFLLLAYQPLPLDVLEKHVAFAGTDAGMALNAALFDGFESVNRDISYALGRAVALIASGDEI